jgi:amino acid permease
MAMLNRKQSRSSNSLDDGDKKIEEPTVRPVAQDLPEDEQLRRGLRSRHVTMIAIGGAIGTGLIIGT